MKSSSSSDTEIANAAPTERSQDDSADEDNIVNRGFNWQCTKNYSGAEKCFVVNVDLEMVLKVLENL